MSGTSTNNKTCDPFRNVILKIFLNVHGAKVQLTLKHIPGQKKLSFGKSEAEKEI